MAFGLQWIQQITMNSWKETYTKDMCYIAILSHHTKIQVDVFYMCLTFCFIWYVVIITEMTPIWWCFIIIQVSYGGQLHINE